MKVVLKYYLCIMKNDINPFTEQFIKDNTVNNVLTFIDQPITVSNDIWKMIISKDMRKSTKSLLLFIITEVKYNCDSVKIPYKETQELLSISRKTLVSAISQLIQHGIIASKKGRAEFFINPNYICQGKPTKVKVLYNATNIDNI